MKIHCKRTCFKSFFSKLDGDLVFKKNEFYDFRKSNEQESRYGIYLVVKSETKGGWNPINKKDANKYFFGLDEERNNKIDEILNR